LVHPQKSNKGTLNTYSDKSSLLHRYFWEIQQYDLLTEEEKRALAIRFQKYGDREAAHRLVLSHLRLVVKIAFQFQGIWTNTFLDLIQEGNFGLVKAADKYDPSKNVKFSYYAVLWIRAYMLRFVMEHMRLVKIGTSQKQRKLFYNLNKEKRQLKAHGFDPQPDLLAQRLGVSETDIRDMIHRMGYPEISLDAPISEDSDETFINVMASGDEAPDVTVAKKQMKELINKVLEKFTPICDEREKDILENRLLTDSPLSLQQIGVRYGISRERVRQIQGNMFKKLKTLFEGEILSYDSHLF